MRQMAGLLVVCTLIATAVCVQAQDNDPLSAAAAQIVEKMVAAATPKSGAVAVVDDGTVPATLYIALGTRDGILEGAMLTIVAQGAPIKVGDEVIGYRESPVGTAEVNRVQGERMCVATIKSLVAGQKPVAGNTAYIKTVSATLAVSSFLRADGAGCQMGVEFANKLEAALQGSGRFQMTERARFEAALGELKLGLNDLFNPEKAAQFGKMIPAKGVVLGGITQKNDGYTISARVVDVETGVQVATATVSCPKTAELDVWYGQVGRRGPDVIVPPPPGMTVSLFGDGLRWLQGGEPRWEDSGDRVVGGRAMLGARDFGRFSGLDGSGKYALFLNREWRLLRGTVGLDDRCYATSVTITFSEEDRVLQTVTIRRGATPTPISVDLPNVETLTIKTTQDGQHLHWSSDCELVK